MEIKNYLMVLNKGKKLLGCDISYWQGEVDFNKLYERGIRFVFIRAGYGTTADKRFISYINGAIKAGLLIGIYWFMYAKNEQVAKANAEKCLEVIAPYKDYIHLGVCADWEYDSDKNAGYLSNARRSMFVREFLRTVEEQGYQPSIYSNQDYIKSGKFTAELIKQYPLWFAKYSDEMGKYATKGKDGHPYFWQYTSKGDGKYYGVSSTYLDIDNGYFELVEEVNYNKENIVDQVQKDNGAVKATDNPYPVPTRDLRYIAGTYMQRGDDVKHAQWHLWRFGLLLDENGLPDATQIDGLWGPKCDAAQKEAENRLGLPIDGILTVNEITLFNSI